MKKLLLLIAVIFSGCTIASYKDGNLFIADLHPGGEALDIIGSLEGKGGLELKREKGDSTKSIETVSRLIP